MISFHFCAAIGLLIAISFGMLGERRARAHNGARHPAQDRVVPSRHPRRDEPVIDGQELNL